MDPTSVVILICGILGMVALVVGVIVIGGRRRAARAGTESTTPTPDRGDPRPPGHEDRR